VANRIPAHQVPHLLEVKISSEPGKVINVSSGGILIDCAQRLHPGRMNRLKIVGVESSFWVPSRVVRCKVAWLSAEQLRYVAALAFAHPVSLFDLAMPADAGVSVDPHAAESLVEPVIIEPVITMPDDLVRAFGLNPAFALNSW